MEKTNKIFLVALVVFSMFFTVNIVNAEEITSTEGTTITSIEDVKNFIPDSITLDIKDTDLFSTADAPSDGLLYNKVLDEVDTIFRSNVELKKETVESNNLGTTITYEQENFFINNVKMYYDVEITDIHTFVVSVYERMAPDYYSCSTEEECANEDNEKTLQTRKTVQIKYTNSDNYNTKDEEYVKNAIKNIDFNLIIGSSLEYEESLKQYESFITNAINDETLKVYVEGVGGGGDGDYGVLGLNVAIAKNDVVYEVVNGHIISFNIITIPNEIKDTDEEYINYALPKIKEIWKDFDVTNVFKYPDEVVVKDFENLEVINDGTFYKVLLAGDNCAELEECYARVILKKENVSKVTDYVLISNDNVKLKGTDIAKDSDIYKELLEKVTEKGYSSVFGAYEIKLISGKIGDGITITFNLGTEYDGKKAVVFHKKGDNTYDEFYKTIEGGKIDVNVTELSPFIVALAEDSASVEDTASNNAQTSSMDIVLYSVLTISSLVGIVYISLSKKKKIAQ